jgi:uncharacterized protein
MEPDDNGMNNQGREFQVFVKPAGALCNLNCSYCYYLPKADLYSPRLSSMPADLLEIYIKQHMDATTGRTIFFSWHGGEPLLAGLEFYRYAVGVQKKYCPAGKKVLNGIQTNGTLLNEDWCRFLAEEQFTIGLSMDGPEEMHDQFRKDRKQAGSFRKVLAGYDLLVMHGSDPEVLCVVNAANVKYPLETYRFFRHLGISYITFIPLVEPLEGGAMVSFNTPSAEAFGAFLSSIFDEWLNHDIGRIKVQIFEEALRTAFNQDHTLCIFKPQCGSVPVVEQNGDIYSCDHFVDAAYKIGNIRESSLSKALDSIQQKAFGGSKLTSLPEYCKSCDVRSMCNGECPKNRFIFTPTGEPGLNYLCNGYKQFFNHCKPFVQAVAEEFKKHR